MGYNALWSVHCQVFMVLLALGQSASRLSKKQVCVSEKICYNLARRKLEGAVGSLPNLR